MNDRYAKRVEMYVPSIILTPPHYSQRKEKKIMDVDGSSTTTARTKNAKDVPGPVILHRGASLSRL